MKNIINETTPLNLLEEQALFFADETNSYNPQFIYEREFSTKELTGWGLPQNEYFQHAKRVLEQGSTIKDTTPIITEAEVKAAVAAFNQRYHLDPPLALIFTDKIVTRCKVTSKGIYFQTPLRYTQSKFKDLLRHELESHVLRKLNHKVQPWSADEVPEYEIRSTEEGIAGLHTFLLREDKRILKSYLTYSAVYYAQQGSFREVYDMLRDYGLSKQIAWSIATRTKRGITDTSAPGGLTKDITYFEGMVQVWDWLVNQKRDPHDLYLGRLSLNLIPKYKKTATVDELRYPSFFADIEQYLRYITEIGDVNSFQELV